MYEVGIFRMRALFHKGNSSTKVLFHGSCVGLNEKSQHRLIHAKLWPLYHGTVWEGLVGGSMPMEAGFEISRLGHAVCSLPPAFR